MSAFEARVEDRAPPGSELPGVNFAGYLRTESGVGAAARGYVRALKRLKVPTALVDLSGLQINRSEDRSLIEFDQAYPHDLNLVCADVELHFAIMAHLGEDFYKQHYNVGIWAWEIPRFTSKWHNRF